MSKNIELKCPSCGETRIWYVQEALEYHEIDHIDPDGNVDLAGLNESYPAPEFRLECDACEVYLTLKDGALVVTPKEGSDE